MCFWQRLAVVADACAAVVYMKLLGARRILAAFALAQAPSASWLGRGGASPRAPPSRHGGHDGHGLREAAASAIGTVFVLGDRCP